MAFESQKGKNTSTNRDVNMTVGQGTSAEMLAYPAADLTFGHTWRNTDTSTLWTWNGTMWINDQLASTAGTQAIETFPIAASEGNAAFVNAEMFASIKAIPAGTYNNMLCVFSQNTVVAQTYEMRFGLYDLGLLLVEQGTAQANAASGTGLFSVTLGSTVILNQSGLYYMVLGANDEVPGPGNIGYIRSGANGVNNLGIAFEFSHPTGVLPADLNPVPKVTTNNVPYIGMY